MRAILVKFQWHLPLPPYFELMLITMMLGNLSNKFEELFFITSGEHPTLPTSEILAILEAEDICFSDVHLLPHVVRLKAPLRACEVVYDRASMTLKCCREFFICNSDYDEIFSNCRKVDWSFLQGRSFAVRVKRVRSFSPHISTRILEREIGGIIWNSLGGKVRVNLSSPEFLIQGVLTCSFFLLGLVLRVVDRGVFERRRPKFRPFTHPSSLDAKISRLFVNLSRAKRNELFLDPFCGAGSFLIEAALIGCRVIGVDIDDRMINGAHLNLSFYKLRPEALIVGDARFLPFSRIDAIATDPPYGRSASTRGVKLDSLLKSFLSDAYDVIKPDGYVCIAAPSQFDLKGLSISIGFRVLEYHFMRVHKSLARIIAVLRR